MARIIDVKTPLDPEVLLLHSMHATEEMGRLFEYELELYSTDDQIDLDKLLGKGFTVRLELADGSVRHFNGLCSRISQGGCEGRYNVYHATVRPWLWFLTRTQTCRIYHEKTVPEIIKDIFDRHALGEVKDELTETYTPWTYCVQYNESDFNFVSRLMETEGIYYYFKHDDGKHALVLCDSYSAHEAAYEDEIPYVPATPNIRPGLEHIRRWSVGRQLEPGKFALAAYDFEKPSVDLQVRSNIKREHALADYEVFEYGGEYVERGDGETYARIRIEEQQAKHERISGTTNARAMAPGYLFTLGGHPRSDQNGEYLVVSAEYDLHSSEFEARDAKPLPEYACTFTALGTKHPFRSERLTTKPLIQGVQVAIVTGGADIDPDKYGRVKVRFYWDRDAGESCWVRVSQNWGGKGWGGMFIPHVGQEVLVQYEGGDPDLPIIVGRVYNAEQMPPIELPGGKTQSIIRDHGGNEIIMEGAAGGQKMRLFSPTHNSTMTLGNSIEESTDSHFKGIAKAWYSWTVGESVMWDVGVDEKKFIHGSKRMTIHGHKSDVINGTERKHVFGFTMTTIGGLKKELIGGFEIKNVLGFKHDLTAGARVQIIKGGDCKSYPEAFRKAKAGIIEKASQFSKLATKIAERASQYYRRCANIHDEADKVFLDAKVLSEVAKSMIKAEAPKEQHVVDDVMFDSSSIKLLGELVQRKGKAKINELTSK